MLIIVLLLSLYLPSVIASSYIVTFTSYLPHETHESNIQHLLHLTPQSDYRIIPRNPPYPTDFLLLETPHTSLISFLKSHPSIHSIQPQSTIRKLQAVPPEEPHSISTKPKSFETGDTESRILPGINPFKAASLWRAGYTGSGIKVAIFDTGIPRSFPVASSHDYTGEKTTSDTIGHGTFVASLIAGSHPSCPGLAPDAELHIFRVFTGGHVSYTSWFLDAFNHALHLDVDILNLSIGGPDFADMPFVEKVNELTAHGIIITSAIGNDGPLYGTLNNPADMLDVIGVGGAEPDASVASFSSRGMTTHDLPKGYGRVKPDVIAFARNLIGESHRGGCKKLSGTSVAAPVVAGVVALLASAVKKEWRRHVINPASVKRALMKTARTGGGGLYEQGAGLIHIEEALVEMMKIEDEFLQASLISSEKDMYTSHDASRVATARKLLLVRGIEQITTVGPSAFFFPRYYDLTPDGCPYMWPHCAQSLYQGSLATPLNVSIFNPAGVEGRVTRIEWLSGSNGNLLSVSVTPPTRFWPWAAGLGVHIKAVSIPVHPTIAEGILKVRIVSVHEGTHSDIELPIKVLVISPPVRERRLLWDTYHSIRYPPGYVPRDSLAETKDVLDWLADHPHTNFHMLYRRFVNAGFYVDILDRPLSCLSEQDAAQYAAVLFIDSEEEFSEEEIALMDVLVKKRGVSLVIAAEWYNLNIMSNIKFEDDNTRSWWSPIMAGANVPAINRLLTGFGIRFGDAVLTGDVRAGSVSFRFESGVPIVMFPPSGELLYNRNMRQYVIKKSRGRISFTRRRISEAAVLGLTKSGNGAVLAYGDSNCIDTAFEGKRCYDFFVRAVIHAITNCAGPGLCEKLLPNSRIMYDGLQPTWETLGRIAKPMPKKLVDMFRPHSRVLSREAGSDYAVCTDIESLVMKPRVGVCGGDVVLKKADRAEPLRSEREYYTDTRGWGSRESMIIRNELTERVLGRGWSVRLRTRSMIVIIVGMVVIILSLQMRTTRSGHAKKRRRSRKRYWRASKSWKALSNSPLASMLSLSPPS